MTTEETSVEADGDDRRDRESLVAALHEVVSGPGVPELHRSPRSLLGARSPLLLLPALLVLGGCATGPTAPGPSPARGVPGFDTRDYPGREAMVTWRDASPYRWVGYYLPAPCHTGTSWVGRREELERMGWGTAVIFVGEQDWGAAEGAPALADSGGTGPSCTRTNLTEARGAADARAADSVASLEGFPAGTTLYLDVERVEALSPELVAYVRAWTEELVGRGRYMPGVYAHERNARELHAVVAMAAARAGAAERPRLWVAGGGGDFDVRASPTGSGLPWASVWQGLFNVRETWGGVRLRIDVNVATSDDPSGGSTD